METDNNSIHNENINNLPGTENSQFFTNAQREEIKNICQKFWLDMRDEKRIKKIMDDIYEVINENEKTN